MRSCWRSRFSPPSSWSGSPGAILNTDPYCQNSPLGRARLRKLAAVDHQVRIQSGSGGQQIFVQAGSRRVRIALQLDAGRAPFAAVQGRVLDPFPHLPLVAQDPTDRQPEAAGIGVDETGGLAASAAVTMDQPKLALAHFPALLHDRDEQPVPHDLGRAITVEVDLHLRCLRDEGSGLARMLVDSHRPSRA
jgi:hypothetical protein